MERDPRLRAVEIREYTGNSEATARKHDTTVTREDRQQAATDWPEQSSGRRIASEGIRSHRKEIGILRKPERNAILIDPKGSGKEQSTVEATVFPKTLSQCQ